MYEKFLEYGMSGAIMALVMYLVVRPLIVLAERQVIAAGKQVEQLLETAERERAAAAREIAAAREERMVVCSRHHEFHQAMRQSMSEVAQSLAALARRLNGGAL